MNNVERLIERLNYDIEELDQSKSECLLSMCALGEEVDDLQKIMKKESKKKRQNVSKITETLVKLVEKQELFEDVKAVYNDLVEDIRAITSHMKTIDDLKIRDAILLIA